MNHPDLQWACAECHSRGPVHTFHVHQADTVQQFAQVPAICPACSADALAILPVPAPASPRTAADF